MFTCGRFVSQMVYLRVQLEKYLYICHDKHKSKQEVF